MIINAVNSLLRLFNASLNTYSQRLLLIHNDRDFDPMEESLELIVKKDRNIN